jgi:hypothetical protein
VTRVIAFADSNEAPPQPIIHQLGFDFAADDLLPELKAGRAATFSAAAARGDQLILVTSLANAVDLKTNSLVARLRVQLADGQVIERDLLAGRDTAEWAYDRADVRPLMKHSLAPVFDTRPGDAANSFIARSYWTRVSLHTSAAIRTIELTNETESAALSVWKITVLDREGQVQTPIKRPVFDAQRWESEADFEGVIILRNRRALPRAWLVTDVVTTDAETVLKRIRGLDQSFDPRQTALVEAAAGTVPRLTGGNLPEGSAVTVTTYEPARIVIETAAPAAALLVTSELFYPGWEATIDGKRATILPTNYLLRGVSLPAGNHRVEMRYRPPAARNGAIITVCTLLILISLAILATRDSLRTRKKLRDEE